jgi:hypothetical protein
MANTRNYSNTSVNTTLNGAITNVGTSVVLTSQTGMPTPPFVLSLEPDTANEELVLVTSGAGTGGSPYVVTRGYDGTSNIAHSSLVTAQHRVSAIDFTDSRTHEAASTNVHGLNGSSITVNGGTQGLTANITYSNSTTETTVAKTFSIAGGSMVAGSMYRVKLAGTLASTSTPTLTFKLKYGSTAMATVAVTFSSAASSKFWIEGLFTCLVPGASGTLNGSLMLQAPTVNTTFTAANSIPVDSTQQTSISTTGANTLTVTATWSGTGTPSASDIVTVHNSTIEQLF